MTAEPLTISSDATPEFPPATAERWGELVAALLSKGGRVLTPDEALAKLTSTTVDGIAIHPLYTEAPRTAAPFGSRSGAWEIRQCVGMDAPAGQALVELENGASAITLDLRDRPSVDPAALGVLLEGVLFDVAGVALRTDAGWHAAAQALLEVWSRSGVDAAALRGLLGADPLGAYLSDGRGDTDADLVALGKLAAQVQRTHPGVRVAAVSGWRIDAAGGSAVDMLGAVVSCGVAYLRAIVDHGGSPADAFAQIELQIAATTDQFVTIATLRALRVMWNRVATALGAPDAADHTAVHAVTSAAMLTVHDPWVNALRDTVACVAAAIGGADSIEVAPFDALTERADREPGRRLARNTQSILALEANLGRVADPAAGSWYVETLTADLAAAGWVRFQEFEAAGGFGAAIESGLVARRVDESWAARLKDVDTRRAPITGVSEFPDIGEPAPRVRATPAHGGLPERRPAERFEALRLRIESAAERPKVFLAAVGSAAAAEPRLAYATSFFEIAGLPTVTGPPTVEPATIVDSWRSSGARAACVCSTDKLYAEHGVAVVGALHDAGAAPILIAGRPGDLADALTAAGLHQAVFVGCDARQILAELVDDLLAQGAPR